ncbi:PaaI family thioesterase [Alkalilimnicola sp. S0819]|uniref:PaaI family thioesterase n=1 Tax=Alkalilimnicola sp. S0819 TaxID=2613922 RepID=UPI00186A6CFB|nr:PaaI family thioesterase [Alkalilimnicola sp. S0819]
MTYAEQTGLEKVDMDFYRSSFVSGASNANRLRVQYFLRRDDGRLFADIWFGPEAAGPPDFAHGGALAAILDEAMGVMGWFNHYPVVTVNISIDYKSLMPLGHEAGLECWIERVDGRKVYTRGEIRNRDGELITSGQGIFVTLPMESLGKHRQAVSEFYGF